MENSGVDVPVLETERLILRGHTLDDFEATMAIWSDPAVYRHFHGAAMTREDIWGRLLRTFGMWAAFGYGSWAVEEKKTGDYIGRVGVAEVKRDLDPELEGMPEAGWTLASRTHGKGYATEATHAALAWIDARLSNRPLFCIIAAANTASIRVAEKAGFRLWRETSYMGERTIIFVRKT